MSDVRNTIVVGDAMEALRTLPDGVADCCVTSPPYWGLRDYGVDGQIGLEATPDEFVARMVDVFREVRRVLRDDGTLWLNLGDSYASMGGLHDGRDDNQPGVGAGRVWRNGSGRADGIVDARGQRNRNGNAVPGLKPKNLIGIPWRVAFALQADGWWLRADIIWSKPNPMPESVTDRPTKAHEYVFLLAKAERYYYDAEAIAEKAQARGPCDSSMTWREDERDGNRAGGSKTGVGSFETRNARSVWPIASQPFSGAHFATMPRTLAERCVLAGSRKGGIVLDPFFGAGTTGLAARAHGRDYLGIELNPAYVTIAEERLNARPPLFAGATKASAP